MAVAEREAIPLLATPAGMLEPQAEEPVTKVRRVQDSLRRDRAAAASSVVLLSVESAPAAAAAVANMELKSSPRFLLDPVAVAVAAMIMARSLEGPEVMAAGLFSLSRILLRSREVLPVMVPPVLLQPPVKEQAGVDQADPF